MTKFLSKDLTFERPLFVALRLTGTRKDVDTFVAWLKTQYNCVTVSRPYVNEGTDQIRVYVNVVEDRD